MCHRSWYDSLHPSVILSEKIDISIVAKTPIPDLSGHFCQYAEFHESGDELIGSRIGGSGQFSHIVDRENGLLKKRFEHLVAIARRAAQMIGDNAAMLFAQ